MKKVKLVLWDLDATLLDPIQPEKKAIEECFRYYNLGECPAELLEQYHDINISWWTKYEDGLITKDRLLVGRFEESLSKFGYDPSLATGFNSLYLGLLGRFATPIDGAVEVVSALHGKVIQCIITNGVQASQDVKLEYSGLGRLMDRVYISENLGFEKPDVRFFDSVLADFPLLDKDEIVVIGDSLKTDIAGACNAGLSFIWFNPGCRPAPDNINIEYNIRSLREVPGIVLKEAF